MHDLEPYYSWMNLYSASEDVHSPFYEREYSEFEFSNRIYDHYIHPQWDDIGSSTLFLKLLYTNYEDGFAIIELIGEWNDCLHNDIMIFKRDFIDHLQNRGISKFILIGENVLNFHSSDDCYYDEWFEDVEENEGWIALLNFRDHVLQDFSHANLDHYFACGGALNDIAWRTYNPDKLFTKVQSFVQKRLGY